MESIWILDLDSFTLKVSKLFPFFKSISRFNLIVDAKMTDGFPEELRSVLHPHWEQFPPQHPLIPYFFGVFLFALSFVSLVGNFLLLYVFLSTKSLRTPVRHSIKKSFYKSKIFHSFPDQHVHREFGFV